MIIKSLKSIAFIFMVGWSFILSYQIVAEEKSLMVHENQGPYIPFGLEDSTLEVSEVSPQSLPTSEELHIFEKYIKPASRVQIASYQSSIELPSDTTDLGTFEITAYDLTETCCGKSREHPLFGITRSGYDLTGKSREEAMVVAVDPSVIPLGSKLYIVFQDPYKHFTGIYSAEDTGGAIKGKILDLFMGDFGTKESVQETWDFGRREVEVYLLEE